MANKNNTQPQLPLYYTNTEVEITIDGVKKISEFVPISETETITGLTFDVLLDGVNRQLPITSIYNDINKIHYIEKTYDEMIDLQTNNQFIVNQNYLITDYRTTYIQPTTNIQMGGVGQENENEIEQIIVTTLSTNQLQNDSRSLKYPQDIIYYNLNDNSEGFTKGKIYRRIDTLQNVDCGTDWRHIKYRRWKLNVTNKWVSGTNYVVGDIVYYEPWNTINICTINDTNSTDIKSHWTQYTLENNVYGGFTSTQSNGFRIENSTNYYIPVDANDFNDSIIFDSYSVDIKNIKILGNTLNNIKIFGNNHNMIEIGDLSTIINLESDVNNLKIGKSNNNVNINGNNNVIGSDNSYLNIHGDDNIIGNYNKYIKTGYGCLSIKIDDDNKQIMLNDGCGYIEFGNNNSIIIIDYSSDFVHIYDNIKKFVIDNYVSGQNTLIEIKSGFFFKSNSMVIYPGIPDYLSWFDTLKTVSRVDYYNPTFYVSYKDSFGDIVNERHSI